MAKHRFRYWFHPATRTEELAAMFHAANDTIGIDKARRNETAIAQSILTSLQRMSTYILRKPTSMFHRMMYQKKHIYPSIKQSRDD